MSQILPDDDKGLEEVVLTRLMRLNARVFGIVSGLLFGITIFIATNWLVLKGGKVIGPNLSLLGQFFIGYRVSFWGSFIGLAYGFITGFFFGYLIALLYNWILDLRDGKKQTGS